MNSKNVVLAVIIPQIFMYLLFFLWLRSKSGGDMAFVLYNTAFAILYILAWGIVSYNWEWSKKKIVIQSFFVVILIEVLVFNIFM